MYPKWIKRLLAAVCSVSVAVTAMAPISAAEQFAEHPDATQDKELRLWYDEPAPDSDEGWENWSIPLGCGYLGANVFGRLDSERIQITENSLFDIGTGYSDSGLNNFSETYIDFDQDFAKAEHYVRALNLNDSLATVEYDYEGVHYAREYFTSYPDKVMAIRLSASEGEMVNFTLRPTIPYLGERKSGTVVAEGDTITLSGVLKGANVQFEGQFRVIPEGGTMEARNDENNDNGTITVSNADSAVILIAVGTNYQIDPQVFLNSGEKKLEGFPHPHEKVTRYLNDATEKGYDALKEAHIADYTQYFDRVRFDLGGVPSDTVTTDQMLANYKSGQHDPYLEELYFQYGRYLMICSSREGTLPPNLQGIWNVHEFAPWTGGYWHNINIQMNYWPVFSTNLAEMFQSYVDYYEAYLPAIQKSTSSMIRNNHPNQYDESGNNGWSTGTGFNAYGGYAAGGSGVDGNATGALMAEVFWDYYEFTQDADILRDVVYPAVSGSSNFMWRVMEPYGDKLLAFPSASPENHVDFQPVGTAWDQELAYSNHLHTLEGAELLGISEDDPLLTAINGQIDKLDPINIGYSGQIKEFREENFYGDFGEYNHRHISQLVGLYPATLINSTTPAWMDAAKATLNFRGDQSTGWAMAHRFNAWARTKDGNRTYTLYQTLLKKGTLNNLWDTHAPFQIDGNFGGTAGVAEMLLQSHEGYIAPLSAIPDAWSSGSYRGLVARGNFTVGADWSGGQADQFLITSNVGGECSVGYYNVASAQVTDSQGNPVSFTSDGTDRITFDTTEGETYTITQIPAHTATAAPENLALAYEDNGAKVLLNWEASPDAASYNIYCAEGNAPDYTLLQSGVTDTAAVVDGSAMDQSAQRTFCVTAVAASGRESARTTAIMYPLSAPASAAVRYVNDTTAEISIAPTAAAERYLVYRQTETGTELVLTSPYPCIVVENASRDDVYFASVELQGRESPMVRGEIRPNSYDNVLLNKEITLETSRHIYPDYPLKNAVDGDLDTRYAVSDQAGPYSIQIDLSETFTLGTLQVYEFQNPSGETRSNETTVEVSADGGETWTTVIDKQSLEADGTTDLPLNGASGSKLRITFHHTIGDINTSATIFELICDGSTASLADKLALQQTLFEANALDMEQLDPSMAKILQEAIDAAAKVMSADGASQAQVDTAQAALQKTLEQATQVNLSRNRPVTTSIPSIGASYAESLMVDGDLTTRYAGADGNQELTVEIDLEQQAEIRRIGIHEYLDGGTRSQKTTIEVFDGTQWQTVVQDQSLNSPSNYGTGETWFDLQPITGEKVRFHFQNTNTTKLITIYEIQVMGEPVEEPVVKHTVTFNTNGGSEIAAVEVEDGKTLTLPDAPTKADHAFAGWFTDAELQNAFDAAAPITEDMTLYAKWISTEEVESIASVGIVNTNTKMGGRGVFNLNLEDARGIALVEVTFTSSDEDMVIRGANGFRYLDVQSAEVADGVVQKTATFCYLPNDQGGVNFACDEATTVAVIAVAGKNSEVKLEQIQVAGYDENGEAQFGTTTITADGAVFCVYDIHGDDVVNHLDILAAQKHYQIDSSDAEQWVQASRSDVNDDNVVNLLDLIEIMMNFTQTV